MDGVYFLFYPDLSKLFDINIWITAGNQVVFVLSLGVGGNILFSKYRERNESVIKSSIIIPSATFIFGLLCSFINFCFLGNLSTELKIPIKDLPINGSELAFVTYPAAISLLPFPNLWALIFFFMLITLGIDTQVSIIVCYI